MNFKFYSVFKITVQSLLLMGSFSVAVAQTAPRRHFSPSAAEILTSMAENSALLKNAFATKRAGNPSVMLDNALTLDDMLRGNFRVRLRPDVSTLPRKVEIKLFPNSSSEGDPLLVAAPSGLTSPFFDFVGAARSVMNLTYPADTASMTVMGFRTAMDLPGLIPTIDDRAGSQPTSILNKCADKVQSKTRNYWFEVLPVNLECHAISPINVRAAINLLWMPQFNTDVNALAVPSTEVFDGAKSSLATEMIVASIIQHAQITIHRENGSDASQRVWARNKGRCFPATGFAVRSVLAAQAVPFDETSPDTYKYDDLGDQKLPEPLYALFDHVDYYGKTTPDQPGDPVNGNRYLYFNNRADGTAVTEMPSMTLKAAPVVVSGGSMVAPLRFSPTGMMHFQFNIRDLFTSPACVAEGGVFFCKNSRAPMTPREPATVRSTRLHDS
jgi:hypothetical protein